MNSIEQLNPITPIVFLRLLKKYLSQEAPIFLLYYLTHAYHFGLKAGLLYLLPESSGILTKCLILPIPD